MEDNVLFFLCVHNILWGTIVSARHLLQFSHFKRHRTSLLLYDLNSYEYQHFLYSTLVSSPVSESSSLCATYFTIILAMLDPTNASGVIDYSNPPCSFIGVVISACTAGSRSCTSTFPFTLYMYPHQKSNSNPTHPIPSKHG